MIAEIKGCDLPLEAIMTNEQKRRINTEIKRLEEKLASAMETLNRSKEIEKEDADWSYWVKKDQMLVDHLNENISKLRAMLVE